MTCMDTWSYMFTRILIFKRYISPFHPPFIQYPLLIHRACLRSIIEVRALSAAVLMHARTRVTNTDEFTLIPSLWFGNICKSVWLSWKQDQPKAFIAVQYEGRIHEQKKQILTRCCPNRYADTAYNVTETHVSEASRVTPSSAQPRESM